MSAEGMVLIGRAGLAAIREAGWPATVVGGLTLGADPVAYAIAAASFGSGAVLDAFTVRKEAKGHGTRRLIEGNFVAGSSVVIVEDVITSGNSAMQAIQAVRAERGDIAGVLVVVDREQGGRQVLEAAGFEVRSLTTATELGLAAAT
jgi:orotate phosphoribosyltransferase